MLVLQSSEPGASSSDSKNVAPPPRQSAWGPTPTPQPISIGMEESKAAASKAEVCFPDSKVYFFQHCFCLYWLRRLSKLEKRLKRAVEILVYCHF